MIGERLSNAMPSLTAARGAIFIAEHLTSLRVPHSRRNYIAHEFLAGGDSFIIFIYLEFYFLRFPLFVLPAMAFGCFYFCLPSCRFYYFPFFCRIFLFICVYFFVFCYYRFRFPIFDFVCSLPAPLLYCFFFAFTFRMIRL